MKGLNLNNVKLNPLFLMEFLKKNFTEVQAIIINQILVFSKTNKCTMHIFVH